MIRILLLAALFPFAVGYGAVHAQATWGEALAPRKVFPGVSIGVPCGFPRPDSIALIAPMPAGDSVKLYLGSRPVILPTGPDTLRARVIGAGCRDGAHHAFEIARGQASAVVVLPQAPARAPGLWIIGFGGQLYEAEWISGTRLGSTRLEGDLAERRAEQRRRAIDMARVQAAERRLFMADSVYAVRADSSYDGRVGGVDFSFKSDGSGAIGDWRIACERDLIDDSYRCWASKGALYLGRNTKIGALVVIGNDHYPSTNVAIRLDKGTARTTGEPGWVGELANSLHTAIARANEAAIRYQEWPYERYRDSVVELEGSALVVAYLRYIVSARRIRD